MKTFVFWDAAQRTEKAYYRNNQRVLRWQHIPLYRRPTCVTLHGATSQNAAIFTIVGVRTLDLTQRILLQQKQK
jgi:hypothetical protein